MRERGENQRFFHCNFFQKRKGQITIFVIAAIVIISIVSLFFAFRAGIIPGISGGNREANVNEFFSSCVEEKIREGVREISASGGKLENPLSTKFLFDGEEYRNISYLCYTPLNNEECISQDASIRNSMQNELKEYVSDDVGTCFNEMKTSFDKQGFIVSGESRLNDFNIEITPKKIILKTDSKIVLSKADETTMQENFEIQISSNIYRVLETSQEIVNQEAVFCHFDVVGFMLTYPAFEIKKINLVEKGSIYSVEYRETGEKFRFAVRSCFSPSGFIA